MILPRCRAVKDPQHGAEPAGCPPCVETALTNESWPIHLPKVDPASDIHSD